MAPGATRWQARARGDLRLMPPTQHTLEEIAEYAGRGGGRSAAARPGAVREHRPVLHRDGRPRRRDGARRARACGSTSAAAALMHPAYGELRAVTPLASVLLQDNPSPMTLEGTNTWVLRAPGEEECVVVDPGDDDPEHQRARGRARSGRAGAADPPPPRPRRRRAPLRRADRGAGARARPVAGRSGPRRSATATSWPPRAASCGCVATPGHTSDSLSFLLDGPDARPAVLTGDTILGRGTTVIAHPDGALGPYLGSLRRLARAARRHGGAARATARSCPTPRPPPAHTSRTARSGWSRCARRCGCSAPRRRPREVVERVYADVDRVLWRAAEASVRAQLDYLRGLTRGQDRANAALGELDAPNAAFAHAGRAGTPRAGAADPRRLGAGRGCRGAPTARRRPAPPPPRPPGTPPTGRPARRASRWSTARRRRPA